MAANEAQKRYKVEELRALAMEEEQRLVKIMLDKFEKTRRRRRWSSSRDDRPSFDSR